MTDINTENDNSRLRASKTRVYMLDILRGAAVLGMVLHHALVSFEIIFDKSFEILYSEAFLSLQLLFVAVFLLVSGVCTNYSRSVLRRGIIVFAAALVVSFATCVVLPAMGFYGLNIYFGILHMIGLSMILYALLKKWLDKINPAVGIVLFTVLFIAYYMFYRTGPTGSSYFMMIFGILRIYFCFLSALMSENILKKACFQNGFILSGVCRWSFAASIHFGYMYCISL